MKQEEYARISALTAKSRTAEGLTEAEQAERAALRARYIAEMRESLRSQLDATTVVNPDGTSFRLSDKKIMH